VPFFFIGFILEFKYYGSKKTITQNIKQLFKNTLISVFLVCVAELGQFFIVHRNPDFRDVFYGFLGSVIGAIVFYSLVKLFSLKVKSKK
jgi:glycopeptide antibiotics resistance protein